MITRENILNLYPLLPAESVTDDVLKVVNTVNDMGLQKFYDDFIAEKTGYLIEQNRAIEEASERYNAVKAARGEISVPLEFNIEAENPILSIELIPASIINKAPDVLGACHISTIESELKLASDYQPIRIFIRSGTQQQYYQTTANYLANKFAMRATLIRTAFCPDPRNSGERYHHLISEAGSILYNSGGFSPIGYKPQTVIVTEEERNYIDFVWGKTEYYYGHGADFTIAPYDMSITLYYHSAGTLQKILSWIDRTKVKSVMPHMGGAA